MGEDGREGRRECRAAGAGESLHGLELVDALLGVTLPNLAQGLVLVSAEAHVLGVDHIICCLLGFIPSICQL